MPIVRNIFGCSIDEDGNHHSPPYPIDSNKKYVVNSKTGTWSPLNPTETKTSSSGDGNIPMPIFFCLVVIPGICGIGYIIFIMFHIIKFLFF